VTDIELPEVGPPALIRLTADQGRLLAASGVVTAVPSPFAAGTWLVGAAGKVGAARVGDMVIRIAPKVSIDRLLFLVGYSVHGAGWLREQVDVAGAPDLVPVVAQALWRQVSRAVAQGLLPGYVVVEESAPVLRGRLLEGAQLALHHGLPLPLEVRHDEFTVDIPENQILRAAMERMLSVPRVDPESSRQLRRLLRDFADVTPLRSGDPVPAWQASRINARYHGALRLAELVLRATSVEQGPGMVAVNGFLVDMPRVFEDFVTVALREALEGTFGGRVVGQARHHLDAAGRVPLRPDIVWRIGGKPIAVIDAKYKAEKPSGYPNADLYQMLAYCTVLSLPIGHLVYAAGNEEPARHTVRQGGIEILCHAVNLGRPADELLAELRILAERIAAGVVSA